MGFYVQQLQPILSSVDSHHHHYLQGINNQYYHVSLSFSTTNIIIYDHTFLQVYINTYYYYGNFDSHHHQYLHAINNQYYHVSLSFSTTNIIIYDYTLNRSTSTLIITMGDAFLSATRHTYTQSFGQLSSLVSTGYQQ